MSSSLKEQLSALRTTAHVERHKSSTATVSPTRVVGSMLRDDRDRYLATMGDLPSMVSRLAYLEASVADIEIQLTEGPKDASVDAVSWAHRAGRAKRGFEKEAAGLRAAIKAVRDIDTRADRNRAEAAEEQCRQLAAEVERLSVASRAPRADAAFERAFVEMARAILSEAAFQRIKARAEEFTRRLEEETRR